MTTFQEKFNKLVKATLCDKQNIQEQTDGNENEQTMEDPVKSQDFFQDNKIIGKKYGTTRIKSRNSLSNIAYVGINKEDYYNRNFVFDVYLLLTKNLNPFSLDRKLGYKNKHEMICML